MRRRARWRMSWRRRRQVATSRRWRLAAAAKSAADLRSARQLCGGGSCRRRRWALNPLIQPSRGLLRQPLVVPVAAAAVVMLQRPHSQAEGASRRTCCALGDRRRVRAIELLINGRPGELVLAAATAKEEAGFAVAAAAGATARPRGSLSLLKQVLARESFISGGGGGGGGTVCGWRRVRASTFAGKVRAPRTETTQRPRQWR